MKIDASRVEAFLAWPNVPIVLIFGPDSGLVAERGLALARSVPGAMGDPFRFAELHRPDGPGFLAEATAASMTGGRRVVRVREAQDGLLKALEGFEKSPADCLVVLEAGELTGKSKLRAWAEKSAGVGVISCYAIEQGRLAGVVTARLREAGKRIDADAAAWVAQNVSGEEGPLRQALEVLVLYAGEEPGLGLADVAAALADGGETSMQDAVDAVISGDPAATDRALALAYEEWTSPVAVLRVLLGEFMRLRVAAGAIAAGEPVSQAMAGMRPPVFFKRQALVSRALGVWKLPVLDQAIKVALAAEAACKQTVTPEQAYCRQTLLAFATRARSAAARR